MTREMTSFCRDCKLYPAHVAQPDPKPFCDSTDEECNENSKEIYEIQVLELPDRIVEQQKLINRMPRELTRERVDAVKALRNMQCRYDEARLALKPARRIRKVEPKPVL